MKAQKPQGAKVPKGETTKVNITLSVKASQRLFVSAIMSGVTASSLVEELIESGLKSWSLPANLSDRANKRHNSNSVDLAGSVELPAEIAA